MKLLNIISHLVAWAWRPDGNYILFPYQDDDIDQEIWVMQSIHGEDVGVCLMPQGRAISKPEWSPCGGFFAYSDFPMVPSDDRVSGVWLVDASNVDELQDIRIANGRGSVKWSPDGEHLAFNGSGSFTLGGVKDGEGIWIIKSDGTEAKRISDDDDLSVLSWTSDGREVVCTLPFSSFGERWLDKMEAGDRVVSIDIGNGRRRHLEPEEWRSLPALPFPATADGKYIAEPRLSDVPPNVVLPAESMKRRERKRLERELEQVEREIRALGGVAVVGVDGSDSGRIADGEPLEWSPDGMYLAYAGAGSKEGQLLLLERGTLNSRVLSGGEEFPLSSVYSAQWSPNSHEIAYTGRARGTSINEFPLYLTSME